MGMQAREEELKEVTKPSSASQRPVGPTSTQNNCSSKSELGVFPDYLCYERIMKGRMGWPLQVYAGPRAGDFDSVLCGASCGKKRVAVREEGHAQQKTGDPGGLWEEEAGGWRVVG